MKIRRCWLIALAFAATSALGAGPKPGTPAPQAVITALDGKRFDIAAQRGNVVILAYWATWCQFCKQELADLSDYYHDHASEGLTVIAISADDPDDAAKVRERARNYPFPVALLADNDVTSYGRIWRLPLTFVIDRRGILRRDGWSDAPAVTRAQLEETVTPLLREKN